MGLQVSKNQMIRIIQDVLKANGTAVKQFTVTAYVSTLAKVSPWFLEEVVLIISQWELQKEDLIKAENNPHYLEVLFPCGSSLRNV